MAGKIASGMCRTCAKISPVEILAAFVPTTCSILRDTLRETDLSTDFYLGDEIMFNLLLLSDLVIVPGYFIIPYIPQVRFKYNIDYYTLYRIFRGFENIPRIKWLNLILTGKHPTILQ